ncbi:cell division protein FtsZ [Thermoflavifilum thermophilum]|uniref:Cell division protein FtsZ n=1 Tax=Thermoflavifilum thermophilum TaxID=1393122 RepID=A0A1I7N483_9BACT|nr:cell division protein FtsZ [Thermoflavifilum thermophilum]SFV29461.1 cell division protein FtsZ [Thermoflavifilum thermophilum]
MIYFDLPKEKSSIIKVIGIGGGGSNAVNYMYSLGIEGVDFIVCNTDAQALANSPVPNKVQLGPSLTQGLGAGANPEIGKQATEESLEEIRRILEVNTKMVFITAGMGGGTGTGGAPIVARICRELGILTVGIVTTPFSYEGRRRMQQAEMGIQNLKEYTDTLLIISNDKLRHQFGNLPFKAAFAKADNILAIAAKCITDVINQHGHINVDFADVCTAMRNGGVAILGSATAGGENRAQKAIEMALSSPLLNDNDIHGAKWVLLNITSSEGQYEHTIDEMDIIQSYIQAQAGDACDVILGVGYDQSLGEQIGVTIIATGFEQKPLRQLREKEHTKAPEEKITVVLGKENEEKKLWKTQSSEKPETEDKPETDALAPKLVDPEEQPVPRKSSSAGMLSLFNEPAEQKSQDYSRSVTDQAGHSRIYAQAPAAKSRPASPPQQLSEDQPGEMKLIYKDEPPSAPAASNTKPQESLEDPDIRSKHIERITKLKQLSIPLSPSEEMEEIPAFIRQGLSISQDLPPADPHQLSGIRVQPDPQGQGKSSISTLNTFLNGKKPD